MSPSVESHLHLCVSSGIHQLIRVCSRCHVLRNEYRRASLTTQPEDCRWCISVSLLKLWLKIESIYWRFCQIRFNSLMGESVYILVFARGVLGMTKLGDRQIKMQSVVFLIFIEVYRKGIKIYQIFCLLFNRLVLVLCFVIKCPQIVFSIIFGLAQINCH